MSFDVNQPVLIGQVELESCGDDIRFRHNFPVDEIAPVLDAKAKLGRDAIADAVGLLLTRSASVIVHVDVTKTRESYVPNDEAIYYIRNEQAIGFNDHCGGSESAFKILLNGSPDVPDQSFVLYSPPLEDGRPSNMTFRQCDFTFMTNESRGPYKGPGFVPNPLKTVGAAQYKGGLNYEHYLFGGPTVPHEVYTRFQAAGFEFVNSPYVASFSENDGPKYWLRRFELEARKKLGYRGMHFWPGDQFAEQLRNIGLEPPKLPLEDYPLISPVNTIQT